MVKGFPSNEVSSNEEWLAIHKGLVFRLMSGSGVLNLNQLVDTLASEPYELSNDQILVALNSLVSEGKLRIAKVFFGFDGQVEVNFRSPIEPTEKQELLELIERSFSIL